jgi:multimeric flavodoxin WrbA
MAAGSIRAKKGQYPGPVSREEFRRRYLERFADPAFDAEREGIDRLEAIAYRAYCEHKKAPHTERAGNGYADPDYELSVEWLAAKKAIDEAAERHARRGGPTRILIVCGSARNDGSCPSEMSKTFRLAELASATVKHEGGDADVLDLSALTSEPHRHIHPCKGCVSTAMPLCHWPCSCYPNHALGQTGDAMAAIYPRWVEAHGILILTPVYWYQSPSPLKLMIDRLVCADGGNADPTSTQGKDETRAKELELAGWPYPKHLAKRAFGLVVHGDVTGVRAVRAALHDWLTWMGLISAGQMAEVDRYIGYYEPYATSHDALDRDTAVQEETRNAARAVTRTASALREGSLPRLDADLASPRPK